MIRYLLLGLFVGTLASRLLGLDFGLAPGVSIKNAMLYAVGALIFAESALMRNRRLDIMPVVVPFGLLILYALATWLVILLFLDDPNYAPRATLIRLKGKLVDQLLVLLVFYYGLVNWKDALWLLKALAWIVMFGCVVTVADSFDMPDLGIITTREGSDQRVEGILDSAQEFGAMLAFFLPIAVALWWTGTRFGKKLAIVGICMMLISVLLSASRGAMVGILAGTVISVVYLRRYITAQILVRAGVTAVVLISAAVVLTLATDFGDLVETRVTTGFQSGDPEDLSSGRTRIWMEALGAMAEHPTSFVTGLGWEAYYQKAGYRLATHNVYLDRFYNLGTIGVTLFVMSFAGAIAIARRGIGAAPMQTKPFLIAAIVGIVCFMIAIMFSDIHLASTYVWACVGLALRISTSHSDARREAQERAMTPASAEAIGAPRARAAVTSQDAGRISTARTERAVRRP